MRRWRRSLRMAHRRALRWSNRVLLHLRRQLGCQAQVHDRFERSGPTGLTERTATCMGTSSSDGQAPKPYSTLRKIATRKRIKAFRRIRLRHGGIRYLAFSMKIYFCIKRTVSVALMTLRKMVRRIFQNSFRRFSYVVSVRRLGSNQQVDSKFPLVYPDTTMQVRSRLRQSAVHAGSAEESSDRKDMFQHIKNNDGDFEPWEHTYTLSR